MGYRTYHTLFVYDKNGNDLGTEVADLHKTQIEEFTNDDATFEQECTWYESSEDMVEYSKKYPELVFNLNGTGDDSEDLWEAYYHNGEEQMCPAIISYDPCKFFNHENI